MTYWIYRRLLSPSLLLPLAAIFTSLAFGLTARGDIPFAALSLLAAIGAALLGGLALAARAVLSKGEGD